MKLPPDIATLSKRVIETLISKHMTIATAESCTGGLIAGALTSVPGSSEAVYGGFVTYADEAKMVMIGVPEKTLSVYGAVSEQAARAMAAGALEKSDADIAIAVTGIAGPDGGTPDKPVGLVHFGCATRNDTYTQVERFGSIGRDAVRHETVKSAMKMILDVIRADQA